MASLSTLVATASKQHGLMTHAQAVEAGLSRTAISRFVRTGAWQVVRPRVFRRAAASQTEEQALLAACLWMGKEAVVSHRSAARLLGLNLPRGELEVTTSPRQSGGAKGLTVHRSRALDAVDRKVLRGIPVTTVARTLIDLAGSLDEEQLSIVVEEAWRRHLAAPDWVARRLEQLSVSGRRTYSLGDILADCRWRKKPLESALEVRVWRMLKRQDLPLPVPGFEFSDDEMQPGRIDFAFPNQRLAVEVDGFEFHGDREAFERDRVRNSRLAALGWRVVQVTSRQLDDERRVADRIRRALAFDA